MAHWFIGVKFYFNNNNNYYNITLYHLLLIAEDPPCQRNEWGKLLQHGCHDNTQHELNPKQCLQDKKEEFLDCLF